MVEKIMILLFAFGLPLAVDGKQLVRGERRLKVIYGPLMIFALYFAIDWLIAVKLPGPNEWLDWTTTKPSEWIDNALRGVGQ